VAAGVAEACTCSAELAVMTRLKQHDKVLARPLQAMSVCLPDRLCL